ncbi:MAG: hypothetical protein UU17_C0046G0003 [Candidatus Nomurabacteria bacterium GW2011_GWA1_40_8]|nr:MAG: hypothetical protein UU17_C0046G0003 [Candidatus Nomurabacteria bacterium GW2011_GWA1_40_8]
MRNTRNSKNSEFSTSFSYHRWVWYVYGYLSLARIGIKKLEEENKIPSTITSFENYFSYRKKYLLIPIIYNIKHAIEIINKALKIQDYKLEFWNRKLINTASVFDLQNDIFRFPDNSADFIFNSEILGNVSPKETKELLDDIKKLHSLLGIIIQDIKKAKNPKLYEKMDCEDKKKWEKEKKIIFSDYEQ